jgi:O-antigen/teichoic acid export membrane protein
LPFAASGLVANAQARLGPLLLGVLSGPAELAAFGVATRLEGVARRLPYAAFGAALPVFSSPAGQTDGVRARFDALVRAFAIAAGLLLITGAGPLVRLTYGGAFVGAAVPLMWAGASLLPSLVNGGRKVYLNATGRDQIVLRWSATALAIQIAAAVVLMPRFGASGAMAAIGLGEIAIWMPLRRADRRVVSGAELAASAGLGTPAPSLPL